MIIDAENALLGRLATVVAKKALQGETINLVNCEKIVICGDKKRLLREYKRKYDMGTHTTGPFMPKTPERFVKRSIRGMLPHKKPRGIAALGRIMCFRGLPEEFANEKMEKVETADYSRLKTLKYLSVEKICRFLGGKI
ncbi:MAG: 50S ribosomal protein L13 [Nanoarchaeota archaeon]|nr:50S ribosomal protein L13 [Nanoarchaeota archaeon]